MKRCARCGCKLKASEVAANWNDEWFACVPCWDESEGFLGWPQDAAIGSDTYEKEPK